MKLPVRLSFLLLSSTLFFHASAQLYKVELDEKVKRSPVIVEGKVIARKSFWNEAHSMIFTSNTIEVYKVFKGTQVPLTVEVVTQGGSAGNRYVEASDLLDLDDGQTGMFFCFPNTAGLKSPDTKKVLYDVFSSDQGFLRYDFTKNRAYAPFAAYDGIEQNLYSLVKQKTGVAVSVIDPSFSVAGKIRQAATHTEQTTAAAITSFSPATVNAGALNDPASSTLTINGSGFGNTPSGSCAVKFKDGNSDNPAPSYTIPYTSPYLMSWSDTKIVVKVPTRAATGLISVTISDGSGATSLSELNVFYSVLNAVFDFSSLGVDTVVASEPRLMNTNGTGGYTYQYSIGTGGGGANFASSPASETFSRALATWKDLAGVNFTRGANTAVQAIADDNINLIVFDNANTGVPVMADGVLEVTYSWYSTCYILSPFQALTAQKTGFDILIRNEGVSIGSYSFANGPCFPVLTGSSYEIDREMVVLHELGHAINLAHINDDYEASPAAYANVNPGKVMHYAILDYESRRSPDNSAYKGALYAVTPQGNTYGSCGLYAAEMTQTFVTVIPNDECPASFPATATIRGTPVLFDLAHATSNKSKDPQFTAVNCQNNGAFVVNNAYYAFKTGATNLGALSVTISGYTTTPAELAACAGQGVRMAVYDVNTCPDGQSFPQPIACRTFAGDGPVTNVTGLLAEHKYLLYFDGLRNTKASFTATLDGFALPVVLARFTGEYLNGKDYLYIEIKQYINVKEVIVQKSSDGQGFTDIGTLPSGSFTASQTFIDDKPYAGNNYYRLKVVNNDGITEYSNIILLKNTSNRFVNIYPNPVKDNLVVSFNGVTAGKYTMYVYDLSGRALSSQPVNVVQAVQTINMPFANVAQGMYLVKIVNAGGIVISQQRVVKE